MKKFLLLSSVLALFTCACLAEVNESILVQQDANFAGCERLSTNDMHLIYKCPSDMERFEQTKKSEPNGAFLGFFDESEEITLKEIAEDENFILVEVVISEDGNSGCEQQNFHYRTMVKPISDEPWAVIGCNQ